MARGQSLYDWCIENGEFGQRLINEWTGVCDDGNHYEMVEVSYGSAKQLKWKCLKGHEWYSQIKTRTRRKTGCQICGYQKTIRNNRGSLFDWCNNNGNYGKTILEQFTGLDENGYIIDIKNITQASNQNLKWKCSKGHEWWGLVSTITRGHGCPYCSGHKVTEQNSLYNWCSNNGQFGQQLIKEWTGICEDNTHYEIDEVAKTTHKHMLWVCPKGHKWWARISDRVTSRTGCISCSNVGTSYPEQFLYRALKQIYPQTISRGKYNDIEYDITVPEERTCIEYSGAFWHSDKSERDQMKKNICKEHGIKLIQIYVHSGEIKDTDKYTSDLIIYKINNNKHDEQLVEILVHILKSFNHSIDEIDIEKAQTEAFNFMHDIESEDNKDED